MRFSIILIFVFLQIVAPSDAGVARYNVELSTERVSIRNEEQQMAQKLLDMLEDMKRDLFNRLQIAADDPYANEDDDDQSGSNFNARSGNGDGEDRGRTAQQLFEAELKNNHDLAKAQQINVVKGKILKFIELADHQTPTVKEEKLQILNEIENRAIKLKPGVSSCCSRALSLYPACNRWWNTTKEKEHTNTINLYFDLFDSKPSPNVDYRVTSAVLNIYKKAFKASTMPANKNITAKVVFFTQPSDPKSLSKRKSTRLGKQILRSSEEQWTQWDVKRAVETWYNNASTNYGITIKVEEDQATLPAREFFNTLNCSNLTALPPLLPETMRTPGYMGEISTAVPFLDITLDETAKTENTLANKNDSFLSNLKELKLIVMLGSNSSAERKTRNRKK